MKSLKRKSLKRKSLKRKSLKRKFLKRKSLKRKFLKKDYGSTCSRSIDYNPLEEKLIIENIKAKSMIKNYDEVFKEIKFILNRKSDEYEFINDDLVHELLLEYIKEKKYTFPKNIKFLRPEANVEKPFRDELRYHNDFLDIKNYILKQLEIYSK